MNEITSINEQNQTVTLNDGTVLTHKRFMEKFLSFWDKRIAGHTIVPIFYEYLFGEGGSNALELLMKGKQHEGYLQGAMEKGMLSKGQKIALGTIIVVVFVVMIVFYMMRSMNLFG